MLYMKIVKGIYTETTFTLTVSVWDQFGMPVDGALISGTWDGAAITSGLTSGGGLYTFSVSAILVEPGNPGKFLNLNADAMGYAPGSMSDEIAVDPAAVQEGGEGEPPGIPGASIFLIGIVSAISVIYIAKVISKKRKLPDR
jgi:hypothetical protein